MLSHFAAEPQGASNIGAYESALFWLGFHHVAHGGVPHLEWNKQDGRFVPALPKKPQKLHLTVSLLHDAHAAVGCAISTDRGQRVHRSSHAFIADTGAQTCVADTSILSKLNITSSDLIPTSHCLIAATQSQINIVGVALVEISDGCASTRQMLYICDNIRGAYLSETAQIDLGIIPPDFPHRPTHVTPIYDVSAQPTTKLAPCGCPFRQDPPPLPTALPFPTAGGSTTELQTWILQYYKSSAFNTCEHQQLPAMTAHPMSTHFRPDAQPKAYHTPIPVPHHWKQEVKEALDMDVRLGTIERVPQGTPTIWCSRMVVVPKKNGSPRRTVDLQALNAATYRETHHTPSPFHQTSTVPANTLKTTLDAWNGYHSLPLSAAAKEAITFITEWGRYRYCRAPQGFHAAGDAYTRAYDDITMDVPRKVKIVDDSLLWDINIEEAFHHTVKYIDLCARNGVIFNPEKFAFARETVDFGGFTLTQSGIKPSAHISSAIANFPVPTDLTGARSWFGLVNQVAFSLATAPIMQPFRDLLKAERWYWDETLTKLFEDSRKNILDKIKHGVSSFQAGRPTCLSTDWSKEGIGFILQQKTCDCLMDNAPFCCPDGWRLILAGSRFTTPAESRYAPVEGEALAVTYGLEKCRLYVLGCPDLIIAVDHAPLVKLLCDRSLHNIPNPRLLRLKEKTLLYKYTIKHIPGAANVGPDALSRRPTSNTDKPDDLEDRIHASIAHVADNSEELHPFRALTWSRIAQASCLDPTLQRLADVITSGFPDNKPDLPPDLRPYWDVRHNLLCVGDAVVYGSRIVVPATLRSEVLDALHAAHQGVTGMKARAQTCVYWPGLSAAIVQRRQRCSLCNTIAPTQSALPASPPAAPEYPFQLVVADYFHLAGRRFLVYADRYTGWVAVSEPAEDRHDGRALIHSLREWFGTYGVPEEISTDGGPPFTSHLVRTFITSWDIRSRLSSAYHPQSNGRAELAVKVAKRALMENLNTAGHLNTDKVVAALMQYRNTPLQEIGHSPAELLYGRVLRDHLPTAKELHLIRPEWMSVVHDLEVALAKRNARNLEAYNLRKATNPLPPLVIGDPVVIQNQHGMAPKRWDKTGIVREVHPNAQYTVQVHGSGRLTLRNRQFLRKIHPVCTDAVKESRDWLPLLNPPRPPPTHTTPPAGLDLASPAPQVSANPVSPGISQASTSNAAVPIPPTSMAEYVPHTPPVPQSPLLPQPTPQQPRRSNRNNKGQLPRHLQDYDLQ